MAVDDRSNGAADRHLSAFVVPTERVLRKLRVSAREHRLGEWQTIYGSVYEAQVDEMRFGENFAEWSSSYDRRPIERAQMEEWRCRTVDLILSLRPRRVLEIGAGSGLILSRVAPRCESYWATDLSRAAVDILAKGAERVPGLANVEVRHQPAHVVDGLPAGYFDTVLLNSVVQYFPDAEYLVDVLRGVLPTLAPGGVILLGDIRNRWLQRCLYAAAELYRADAGAGADRVRQGIEQQLRKERELLLEPEFFAALPTVLGDISAVDVRLKRGTFHNELTRYRYDVLLYRSPVQARSTSGAIRLRWGSEIADRQALEDYLAKYRPATIRLDAVPNLRLAGEIAALRTLDQNAPMSSVIERLNSAEGQGLDPEVCHEIGQRLGYEVRTTWTAGSDDGHFDAAFASSRSDEEPFVLSSPAFGEFPARDSVVPLNGESTATFEKVLRTYLARVFENIPLPKIKLVIAEELPNDRA